MNDKDEKDIEPGALVIIFDEESDPGIRLGLVRKIFPAGRNYNVQIGPTRKDTIIAPPDKLRFVIQTDNKFDDPMSAFVHYRDDILFDVLITVSVCKEYRAVQRLRERQRQINQKLRHRIGRHLINILGRIHFKKRPQEPNE